MARTNVKKAVKKKAARRPKSQWVKHAKRAAKGKAASSKTFDPTKMTKTALARVVEVPKGPSPSKTRYPVDMKTFENLKCEAGKKKTPAKKACTMTKDSHRAGEEVARMPVARSRMPVPAAPAAAPGPAGNFEGIKATGWLPPDCTMATGPKHVVLSVNSSVAVFSLTGTNLLQRTLAQWFSNVISGSAIFDPKLLYDQYEGRFVLAAVARNVGAKTSSFLISISKTSDPTGAWHSYKLDAKKDGTKATNNWADYPALGVDAEALYLTANMFKFGGGFAYAKIRVVPKAGPYSGGSIAFSDIVKLKNEDGTLAFTIQPCHQFGSPGSTSLVNSLFPGGSQLSLWSLKNPTATPTISRLTVKTDPYSLPPDAAQNGGAPRLDAGDIRMLNAVARDGCVWCALTSSEDWGAPTTVSAIHWFQINATSGNLVQQGIYGARSRFYFYPAVMPDANGNMTMVFCRSGSTEFASIRYTGRKATDAVGALQGSALLKAGEAHYKGLDGSGRNRWGDYNGVGLDPNCGRTTWFYAMYADKPQNNWGTWVGSSSF